MTQSLIHDDSPHPQHTPTTAGGATDPASAAAPAQAAPMEQSRSAAPELDPVFAFEGVSWGVGKVQILRELSHRVAPAQVTTLLGPNGSGKSSLLRILAGVQEPDSGSVEVFGSNWLRTGATSRARTLAFVQQSVTADRALSVLDVVLLGRMPHRSIFSSPTGADAVAAREALAQVSMIEFADREFGTLSGGERQRVLLAKALAQDTEVLVVDEPTNHLDISAQLSILALLRDLADHGKSIITALHDLNLAAAYSDELVVMQSGRFVASGSPTRVLTEPLIKEVYGVDATVMEHPRTGRPLIVF
ncbi:ABC transporter ATP-binding protein [Timonella senegalensis]|uniref:ABC transporter ATP-binding protein n=1 Tax=Timonella senegalensis TaxID=1465825 RepID=UPI0028AE0A09|nr:ABC transporter ATP-binding protein [Timonella senegalensis]